jgi:hypothetical protein
LVSTAPGLGARKVSGRRGEVDVEAHPLIRSRASPCFRGWKVRLRRREIDVEVRQRRRLRTCSARGLRAREGGPSCRPRLHDGKPYVVGDRGEIGELVDPTERWRRRAWWRRWSGPWHSSLSESRRGRLGCRQVPEDVVGGTGRLDRGDAHARHGHLGRRARRRHRSRGGSSLRRRSRGEVRVRHREGVPALRATHLQPRRRNASLVDLVGRLAGLALDLQHRDAKG